MQLTTDEKIGQMLQIRIYGDYGSSDDPAYRFAAEEIRRYKIGSVDLGARMSGPNLVKGIPYQIAAITNQLQRESKLPLLVGADIERGLASRLSDVAEFPFPMAFGATDDVNNVEEFGSISAREARAVGIQWAFAPVADVNSNPVNPIINVRSFGENSEQVGKLVSAYIRGAHRNGLFVTVKHFPGQGDTSTDSHVGITRIDANRPHLEKYELPPFKMAIAAGADSVLLAHAVVPALEPDERRITTNSYKILHDTLREELGFEGIILTDALEMRGMLNLYSQDPNPSGRAAVDAIKAGADVLMLPKDLDGTFNAILAAVHTGEVPESRIDESVRRILSMKAAAGLNGSRFVDLNQVQKLFPDAAAENLAQEVADQAVTLVRSNGRVLPLPKRNTSDAGTGLIMVSFIDSKRSREGAEFERQFKLRRSDARIFHYYNDRLGSDFMISDLIPQLKTANRVVVAAFVTHVPGRQVIFHGAMTGTVGLTGDNAQLLEEIVRARPENTVVVALGDPYLIEDHRKLENYICTYSLVPTGEISAVKSLFGEIQNHAKLPITLPGVAERGFSIPWPKEQMN
jgi:beta-N-acetylhexosaminidase